MANFVINSILTIYAWEPNWWFTLRRQLSLLKEE